MPIIKCEYCGKEFERIKSKIGKHTFCCYQHYLEYIKLHKLSKEEKIKRRKEKSKNLYKKYKEKRNAESREYYKKNKEKIREKAKERDKINKIKRSEYRENIYKELINKNLLTDCVICGFSKKKYFAMDFHHINPKEKKAEISQIICVKSKKDKVFEEIKKCVCLCANCYRLYHANDEETVKIFNEALNVR